MACRCALFKDMDVDDFSIHSPISRFTPLAKRGQPQWWLSLSRCSDCGQNWLVAQEEKLNDVYVIKRLNSQDANATVAGNWPPDLDRYEDLLEIGKAHGHAARYAEPMETLPICIDLVGQNPDIKPETIAHLLNVSLDNARDLREQAKTVIATRGYPYPWTAA
jgi:hypothetical protein